MSWLGGIFTRAGGTKRCEDEFDNGDDVDFQPMDDDFNDLAGGINATMPSDGSKPFNGDVSMSGFDLLDVNDFYGDATFINDVAITGNLVVTGTISGTTAQTEYSFTPVLQDNSGFGAFTPSLSYGYALEVGKLIQVLIK